MRIKNIIPTILLGGGFVFSIGAICYFVFHKPDFWSQLLAIIASAFLGAGATAWITNTLLKNQQESEEEKEKNIKIFENKIQVYSEFISKMWKTLEDDIITEEEIRGIRHDIFNKLIFYYDDISKLVEKVGNIESSKDGEDNAKRTGETITCFSEITELLRADVYRKSKTAKDIKELWTAFGLQPRDVDHDEISEEKKETANEEIVSTHIPITKQEIITTENSERLKQQAWHFIMWNDTQLDKLKEGFKELSAIEYGEYWRTNLVKQVRENDIIMLFRRGGYGYVGAYRAKGWRVFDFEKKQEEILLFGKDPQIISGEQYLSDASKYDIYESMEDGATSCANIIVEPIAFVENGVGNPGGVYRKTISRYDSHYAWMLKNRFQEKGQWLDA
jgi:hypothetical protein